MVHRVALALLLVIGSAVLVGAGMLVASRWPGNVACELAGSREASDVLGRRVEAKRSPLAGFFESCDYYPPASRLPIGDLDVYTENARTTYESDRASYEAEQPPLVLRDENVGVPAYSVIWPQSDRADAFSGNSVCAYALDGDHYLRACIFVDRYGSVDDARAAAVRLVRAALEPG